MANEEQVYQPKLNEEAMLRGYLGIDSSREGLLNGYITSNSNSQPTQQPSKEQPK